jgi:hypothetical protein
MGTHVPIFVFGQCDNINHGSTVMLLPMDYSEYKKRETQGQIPEVKHIHRHAHMLKRYAAAQR